ncbi:hypothetical protein H8I69_04990 [Serratia fonticola]|uniref:hypothetical protein n=1 Tax=Serratia fonticola TaxID=47917 RepID=UPI0015C62FDE|nr:hypothetical protein [Serratia fonticola]MBC3378473.1 hypothetical protein [Serratia fonticola]NYA37673.1 hypothetical protein [Serratia fonticola]
MSGESKSMSATGTTITTGAVGAMLSVTVPALITGPDDAWRTVAYAAVPIISAIITYLMNWVICRHGFESPADASKRAKCLRDLKTIDEQLQSPNASPAMKKILLKERDKTVTLLISIGKESIASPPTVSTDEGE